jgi:hypothetical protein
LVRLGSRRYLVGVNDQTFKWEKEKKKKQWLKVGPDSNHSFWVWRAAS